MVVRRWKQHFGLGEGDGVEVGDQERVVVDHEAGVGSAVVLMVVC